MGTILKDMPIHMERIENYTVSKNIQDIIESHSDWSECRQANCIDEKSYPSLNDEIRNAVIDFVNQNYEWKGLKA